MLSPLVMRGRTALFLFAKPILNSAAVGSAEVVGSPLLSRAKGTSQSALASSLGQDRKTVAARASLRRLGDVPTPSTRRSTWWRVVPPPWPALGRPAPAARVQVLAEAGAVLGLDR
jgi:hypothetical protein